MKDLIDKLLAALPRYVRQLIELLLRPKQFVADADLESDTAIQEALTFLAVSFGVAFIGQLPFLPEKQNKEVMFGVFAIHSALGFILSIIVLGVAWRMAGGKLPWKKFIVPSCYFSGISTLLSLAVLLLAAGTFYVIDPVLCWQVFGGNVAEPFDLLNSTGFRVFWIIFGAGILLVFGWVFWIWGAYRELNQVSKARSGIAFAVYCLLSVPATVLVALIGSSGMPHQIRTTLPLELAGRWETRHDNVSGKEHSQEIFTFNIGKDGYYFMLDVKGWTNGMCAKIDQDGSVGHITVAGPKLVLTQSSHTVMLDDRCTGKKSETKLELNKEVYQYEIRQSATGQQLYLSGRFGQQSLSPVRQKP